VLSIKTLRFVRRLSDLQLKVQDSQNIPRRKKTEDVPKGKFYLCCMHEWNSLCNAPELEKKQEEFCVIK
jgi:hypothetical protein